MKFIGMWCLIAQMKRQNTLIATQKTLTLSDVPLLKKSRKKTQKCYFLGKWSVLGVFLILSATVHCTELRFFALQSVRPGASFKLSNTPKQWFSFFGLQWFFSNFQTPRTGVFLRKKNVFFLAFSPLVCKGAVI